MGRRMNAPFETQEGKPIQMTRTPNQDTPDQTEPGLTDVQLPSTVDFEETSEIPTGRKARMVSQVLWDKLADSAKRDVGFARQGSAKEIAELRKDLTSAAVKAKYDVTTGTREVEKGVIRLTFKATLKVAE